MQLIWGRKPKRKQAKAAKRGNEAVGLGQGFSLDLGVDQIWIFPVFLNHAKTSIAMQWGDSDFIHSWTCAQIVGYLSKMI